MPLETARPFRSLYRYINGLESELYVDGRPFPADAFSLDFAELNLGISPEKRKAGGTLSVFWTFWEDIHKDAPTIGLPVEPVPAEARYVYLHADGGHRLFGRLILPRFQVTGWGHRINLLEGRDPASDRVVVHWESEGWDFKRGDEA